MAHSSFTTFLFVYITIITYVDYLLYSSRLLINAVMSWWCVNANSFLTYTTRASRLINVNKSGIMAVEAAQKVCLPRLWYICMPCMHANIVFYRLNKPTSSCLQYIMRACMIALSLSSQHSIFCQFRVVLFLYNLIAWPSDCVLPIIWIPCSRYRCFDFGYVICVRLFFDRDCERPFSRTGNARSDCRCGIACSRQIQQKWPGIG